MPSDEIKPASPLPWQLYYGDDESNQQQTIIGDDDTVLWSSYPGGCENNAVNEDAEYAVHAANEYPALKAERDALMAVVRATQRVFPNVPEWEPDMDETCRDTGTGDCPHCEAFYDVHARGRHAKPKKHAVDCPYVELASALENLPPELRAKLEATP